MASCTGQIRGSLCYGRLDKAKEGSACLLRFCKKQVGSLIDPALALCVSPSSQNPYVSLFLLRREKCLELWPVWRTVAITGPDCR